MGCDTIEFNLVIIVVVVVVADVVVVDPRNLHLKLGQNWVNNSWDICDVDEVPVVGVVGGVKSFLCQTQPSLLQVELWSGWGFDNIMAFKGLLTRFSCIAP